MLGPVHKPPRFVDVLNITCSLFKPSRPSTHVNTIWSVASPPVGAPLAMSTEGAGPRSSRAPPTPSSTQRPMDGSIALHVSNAWKTVTGREKVAPPFVDLIIWIRPGAAVVAENPNWNVKTYTLPSESVR